MTSDCSDLVEGDLTRRVIGGAMAVLNELGHGFREKTYERALCVEFRYQRIAYDQQRVYEVHYRAEHIDDYVPDLQVEDRLIVDVKTADSIIDDHVGQVLNYLKVADLDAGLILNFKRPRLEWRRVVSGRLERD